MTTPGDLDVEWARWMKVYNRRSMGAYDSPLADEPVATGSGVEPPSRGPHADGSTPVGVEVPRDLGENYPVLPRQVSAAAVISVCMALLAVAAFIITVAR